MRRVRFFGIEGVSGWSTNLAMRIAGTGRAWLQYNYVENDSHTNVTFPEGAFTFWIRPTWSSTNIEGGTGPGVPGRLLELGAYSELGNWGWFSLFLDEAGTMLSLGVQSNQFTAVPIQTPISWASNEWHMVALNYTLTNMELFLDGQLAASVTNGLPYWPSYGVLLTNGFFIGSDSSGSNLANVDFEYIRTYDYAILSSSISAQYNRVLTNYLQGFFGMNGFENAYFAYGMEGNINEPTLTITFDGTTIALTVIGGTSGVSYDLFSTSSLIGSSVDQASWTWLNSIPNGQTCYLYNQPSPIFFVLGTPQDSDGDGLTDAFEKLASKTNPNDWDTDGDGLSDYDELAIYHTNPNSSDTDNDGLSDKYEIQHGMDPNNAYSQDSTHT